MLKLGWPEPGKYAEDDWQQWPYLDGLPLLPEDECIVSEHFMIHLDEYVLIWSGSTVTLAPIWWLDKYNPGWRELSL